MTRLLGFLFLGVLVLLVGCSTKSNAPASPSSTATTRATAPSSSTPTATSASLRRVTAGEVIQLLVRRDAPDTASTCLALIPFAVAGTAPADAKSVMCTVGLTEPSRASFRERDDHSLQLAEVVFLSLAAGLPQGYASHSCADAARYILDATADPSSAQATLPCDYRLGVPGSAPRTVWGLVLEGSDTKGLTAATPCWQLMPYLGQPSGMRSTRIPCVFEGQ